MKDLARKADRFEATVVNDASASGSVSVGGVFTVECYDAAGQLKWKDEFHNLVVNQGLKDMNDKYFTGSGYTAAWYIGLINNSPSPTLAAGNTAAGITTNASGSNVWAEFTGYSQANRPTLSFSASTTADPSVISTAFSLVGSSGIVGGRLNSSSSFFVIPIFIWHDLGGRYLLR